MKTNGWFPCDYWSCKRHHQLLFILFTIFTFYVVKLGKSF